MRTYALPGGRFWAMLLPYTGEWFDVRPTERGFSSDARGLLTCEKGVFFVKAMRNRPGGRRESLLKEEAVNPAVRPLSPPLRWRAEDEEWIALGFDAVEARQVEFEPGSADLPQIVDLVRRIGALRLPPVVADWPETRWDRYAASPEEAALFRGRSLVHSDVNPGNLLTGPGRGWVVDWSWPTMGAAFIDPACLVLQLVAAGHDPAAAEELASGCPAWRTADPQALDAFATASVRLHRAAATRRPDEPWLTAMTDAALAWAGHRGTEVSD